VTGVGQAVSYPVGDGTCGHNYICVPDSSGSTGVGGTVSQRSTLTLNGIVGTYNNLYNQPSSLAAIAGNWSITGLVVYTAAGTLNISSSGVIFDQDPQTQCTINGQVSLINPNYNAYNLNVTYSNCIGVVSAALGSPTDAFLDGATGSGIATVNNTVTPNTLFAVVTLSLSTGGYMTIGYQGTLN
jgi:hypothetical protein